MEKMHNDNYSKRLEEVHNEAITNLGHLEWAVNRRLEDIQECSHRDLEKAIGGNKSDAKH